jgi:hypothetical protein
MSGIIGKDLFGDIITANDLNDTEELVEVSSIEFENYKGNDITYIVFYDYKDENGEIQNVCSEITLCETLDFLYNKIKK